MSTFALLQLTTSDLYYSAHNMYYRIFRMHYDDEFTDCCSILTWPSPTSPLPPLPLLAMQWCSQYIHIYLSYALRQHRVSFLYHVNFRRLLEIHAFQLNEWKTIRFARLYTDASGYCCPTHVACRSLFRHGKLSWLLCWHCYTFPSLLWSGTYLKSYT